MPSKSAREEIDSGTWSSAPYEYRPRPTRQRTTSFQDSPRQMDLGGPRGFDYLSPGRRDRNHTASSDSSSSSSISSLLSASTVASSLSDSPIQLSKLDLPYPPSFSRQHDGPSGFDVSLPPLSRTRRPSLSGGLPMPMPRRQNSYIDFAGSSQNVARLPPPVVHEAMAPLQLDSDRARELEREAPLTLPRPWGFEKANSMSNASRNGYQSQAGFADMSRTRSRSPERGVQASKQLSEQPTSVITPDLPKTKFVEGLVGAACIAVNVVWKTNADVVMVNGLPTPRASPTGYSTTPDPNVLPLRHFIKEVLRRSRSTCSTLQTALYYIHKSRDAIRLRLADSEEAKAELVRMQGDHGWNGGNGSLPSPPYGNEEGELAGIKLSPKTVSALLAKTRDPVLCGRRMFLAALICASKFLQDRTYSNRAWSKISSLPVQEINANEKAFLEMMDYNLYVDADLFKNWTRRLQDLAEKHERKAVATALPPSYDFALPKPNLTAIREGLLRSQSDYAPAPDRSEFLRASAPHHGSGAARPPYTPAESPRQFSGSPEHARTPLRNSLEGFNGMQRSNTDPRFEHTLAAERRLPPLGASLNAGGRLPLPALSVKIPQYAPPSPSPLAGRMGLSSSMEDDASPLSSSLGRIPKPALSKRYATSLRDSGADGAMHGRARSTSRSRFDPSNGMDGLRRSSGAGGVGSCSSLARLLNTNNGGDGADWRDGDNMVL